MLDAKRCRVGPGTGPRMEAGAPIFSKLITNTHTMHIVFDTETNGLPKNWGASAEDVNNWPRVTQLCYGLYDKDGQLTKQFNSLIKPEGWTIPKEKFFIENNMTTERCEAEGMPISMAMEEYIRDRHQASFSIAHNMSFDSKILRAEMFRLNIDTSFTSQKICTMMSSTKFCNLPGARGLKWPKLEELHQILFGCKFEGAHDAFNDVNATARCFFELKRRGVIQA